MRRCLPLHVTLAVAAGLCVAAGCAPHRTPATTPDAIVPAPTPHTRGEPHCHPRALASPPIDHAHRVEALRQSVAAALETTVGWETIACTPEGAHAGGARNPAVRDLVYAALAAATRPPGGGLDPARARALVQRALAAQRVDGFIPWGVCDTEIPDANSLEFTLLGLAPLVLGHPDVLGADFVATLREPIERGLRALGCDVTSCQGAPRPHPLAAAYTNIFLMNTAAQLMLARTPGIDPALAHDAASRGEAQLAQWLTLARTQGIAEYDSPTYYGADLQSLLMAYLHADPSLRPRLREALDLVWTDVAASYFPGRESLSGPHSRDYDFVRGQGAIDLSLFLAGLRAEAPGVSRNEPSIDKVLQLESEAAAEGYRPDARALRFASDCEREVTQWFGPDAAHRRYHFITDDFAIGGVSASYGAQDRDFAVEIGGPSLPAITVVADDTDAPYGHDHVLQGIHRKPVHLVATPLAVQERGTLLAMLDVPPRANSTTLATNVLLPLHADTLRVDDAIVPPGSPPFERPMELSSVVGVRAGTGCAAVRAVMAEGYGGENATEVFQVDPVGRGLGVARLSVYHSRAAVTCRGPDGAIVAWQRDAPPPQCRARAAFLFVARACHDDQALGALMRDVAHAAVTVSDDANVWSVAAQVDGVELVGARDRATGRVVARAVDGVEMAFPGPFCVNGRDAAGARCHGTETR